MVDGKLMPEITVSICVAEDQRNEETQQFVHRADITMYWAKEGSGNIVAISSEVNELPITVMSQNLKRA